MSGQYELSHIVQFVLDQADGVVVVGVDAPLIITNSFGQRKCETLLSKKYSDRHASCHSSNLSRYQDATSLRLTDELVKAGFEHAPDASNKTRRILLVRDFPVEAHPISRVGDHLVRSLAEPKATILTRRVSCWQVCGL
jgi:predicted RNase H-like nuclease